MSNRTPTTEQMRVIESDRDRSIVTASAGAGKTYVLVERYLWLIEKFGLEPHQILTITFTRKAAAEMKERIVQELRDRGQFDRAQVAETGPIQTIHSFCERLLRENSPAAGIDPDFEIMGEQELAQLKDAAIAKAITSTGSSRIEAEALLRRLAGQREFRSTSPYAKLEGAIAKVLGGLRGTRVTLSDLEALTDPDEYLKIAEGRLIATLEPEIQDGYRFASGDSVAEKLKATYRALKRKAPAFLSGKLIPEPRVESASHSAGLIQLAVKAWSELEYEMHHRQRFDYSLLESKAVRLLQESVATRRRISDQYAAIMVDEAQDVNPVQHILLDSLAIGKTMIVGDGQQSIYGFRLADVEDFRRRQLELESLRLTRNWRSDDGIIAFIDDTFSEIWQDDYERMAPLPEFDPNVIEVRAYPGIEVWEQVDRDVAQIARTIMALHEETGTKMGEIAILTRFGRYANDLHQRLTQFGIKSRVVGGTEKFYVRLEIRDLANILRALADPYDDFALIAALRSPIAGISLDSVALLSLNKPVVESLATFQAPSPEDAQALASFLRWFTPLSARADRLAAWEVIGVVLAQSNFLPTLARKHNGERMIANVRKLLTLATKSPELGPIEFAEQIREIQRLAHKEGDAVSDDLDDDTLTIMTVHKAKGLEFPTVILPDVHGKIGRKADAVEVDARTGLVATKFIREDTLLHKWLVHNRKERELAEEMRILYVAMTRAKSRLCLVAHAKPRNPNSIAKVVAEQLGLASQIPPGVVRRATGEPDSN
jgi:ATP-dependent helicase/nuclease subunit A